MTVSELAVKISGDMAQFEKAAAALDKKVQKLGQGVSKVGSFMNKWFTLPIIGAGAAAVKFASDAEESINKVDVAFGGSAGAVMAWAETTLKAYGIAESSAMDMAALFGDMGTAMGLSQKHSADMSMSLVGLAGDLASFKNIGLDQATLALRGIFTGEGEALKTLGIVMQESTLEAYALATGQEKAYKEMSQAEKVALRYAFVMDAAKNSQGDFERTSEGTANQMRIFQESLKELAAAFGQVLLPVITPLIAQANEWIQRFADLDEGTKKTIIRIAAIVAAAGPLIFIIGKVISVGGALIGIVGKLGVALTFLATNPVGIAITAIAALVTAGILLWKNWDKVKKWWGDLWQSISDTVYRITGVVKDKVYGFIGSIMDAIRPFLRILPDSWEAVWDDWRKTVANREWEGEVAARWHRVKETVEADSEAAGKAADEAAASFDDLAGSISGVGDAATGAYGALGGKGWLDEVDKSLEIVSLDVEIARSKYDLLAGSATAAEEQFENLSAQLAAQEEELIFAARKVDILAGALDRMRAEQGANSIQTKELTRDLINAQQAYQDVQKAIDETSAKLKAQSKAGSGANSYLEYYIARQVKAGAEIDSSVTEKLAGLLTPKVPIPVLDNGAIVSSPTLALLAKNGKPEAVTPLNRMKIDIDYSKMGAAVAMAMRDYPQQVTNNYAGASSLRRARLAYGG